MCGGGDNELDPMSQLQITGAQKKDAATEARERELWKHASDYALQQPFSNQYSTMPRDFPGLGAMSQRGQEYTTDAILGKGQYSPADPTKNLGFTDYKPWVDPPPAIKPYESDYDPDDEYRDDPKIDCTVNPDDPSCVGSDPFCQKYPDHASCQTTTPVDCTVNPDHPDCPSTLKIKTPEECARFGQVPDGAGGCVNYYDDAVQKKFDLDYEGLSRMLFPLNPQLQAQEYKRSLQAGFDEVDVEGVRTPKPYLQMLDPRGQGGTYGARYDWEGELEQAALSDWLGEQGLHTGSLNFTPLTTGDWHGFQGMTPEGIVNLSGGRSVPLGELGYDPGQLYYGMPNPGEVAAAQATQLASQTPPSLGGLGLSAGPPGMSPAIGDPNIPPGIVGPDIAADRPGPDQAYMPPDIGGPGIPPPMLTGGPGPGSGAVPQLAGSAPPYTPPDIGGPGIPPPTYPPTRPAQEGLLRPDDAGSSPTVGVGEMELGALATQRMLEQASPTDPDYKTLGDEDIISTSVARPTDIADVADVDPKRLGAATILEYGANPLYHETYARTAGVDAQVEQAQVDYEREQNRLQSEQAQAQAWGSRGQLPEEMKREAHQRNIAQIRGAGYDRAAQMMEADTARRQQERQQTQQLDFQSGVQNAQNEIRVAEQNMQAALRVNDQQAALNAQRRMTQAQMDLDVATRNQAAEFQAAGMGLDAQGQFRGQQLAAAQQLADIGGMTQGATFGAGEQLQQMGAQQDQARRLQQAFAYEQWLRGQEGGAQALALRQGMMPGGTMQQFGRAPDRFGQILGAATAVGGAFGSDVRLKENIKYAGVKNGFNLYEFNYLGSDNRYRGVMAQEVMKQRPDAVGSENGVYWVNYDALGLQLEAV